MAEAVTAETMVKELGLIPHPEGGFFLETHRSGSTPMSSQGQTDLNVPRNVPGEVPGDDLVVTNRTDSRPDRDGRRNALTSIYWMATESSPKLKLAVNLSDHVHYYHGGEPFEYILVDPQAKKAQRVVLGGNILAGHKLQVPVKGGIWKCGRLLAPNSTEPSKDAYCLIGEAVGPGFDFYDFTWVTAKMVKETAPQLWDVLKPFLHEKPEEDSSSKDDSKYDLKTLSDEWISFYN